MGRETFRSALSIPNTKRIPTGETPFLLADRTEAIIPVDVCMLTLHTKEVDWDQNAAQLLLAQDKPEERQRHTTIQIAAYQQQIKASHHKKVRKLKNFISCHPEYYGENVGKLGAN